jgi:polar amino acid transport system substrate-binding protein
MLKCVVAALAVLVGPDLAAAQDSLKSQLPADIAASGTMVISAFVNPPFYIQDENNHLVGAGFDLAEAIGAAFGLKISQVPIGSTAASRVGVLSGRYAFSMGPYNDSLQTEKEVDIIPWVKTTPGFIHNAGDSFRDVLEFCGKNVGIVSGSTAAEGVMTALAKACIAAGKQEQVKSGFGDQNAMLLGVESRRIDAALVSSASALHYEKVRAPRLKALVADTDIFGVGTYSGIFLRKDDPLSPVVLKAMQMLHANGSYAAIMAKYNLTSLAKDRMELNPLSRCDGASPPAPDCQRGKP